MSRARTVMQKCRWGGDDGLALEGMSFGESVPFTGDAVRWKPSWTSGATTETLAGQPLRFEVELKSARLDSMRGDFRGITQRDSSFLQRVGVVPPDLSDFF